MQLLISSIIQPTRLINYLSDVAFHRFHFLITFIFSINVVNVVKLMVILLARKIMPNFVKFLAFEKQLQKQWKLNLIRITQLLSKPLNSAEYYITIIIQIMIH